MDRKTIEIQLEMLIEVEELLIKELKIALERQAECYQLLSSFSGGIDDSLRHDWSGNVRESLTGRKNFDDT